MEHVSLPVQKWQSLGMDWIVDLPPVIRDGRTFDSVLTVTDCATKMVHFIPTWKQASAVDTAGQFLTHVVKYHGLPRSIISDRDSRFMSAFWEQLCSLLNMKLRHSSAVHPQTNGQTERMNATIQQLLRVAQYEDRQWLDVLDIVEMAVNNAYLVDSDFSPFYLTYGFHPTFYQDLPPYSGTRERMRKHHQQFIDRLLAD